ncbi:50S ribosomal protein L25 [Desulfuromonas acetoxidans]|uniref:Large ribosomal subunit protein bL25 n=1 Tax=Desulfuromonas acetoxidans (strain DSM 684 / 11070) TaxID=281689 RepID=Q1JY37_DESA6|nr:50S ribosomal protein L25 [Desulfuromonas acetoxidans]EAT15159.1 ribosomal 5S rRNA E-loop binding protein Ctc/L25/TL5 [Desulfuromonas acetoxidans DSM 684]MBF0643985.1 50S ribosomal protein L25 [Desulfuromonas acetoxidans]NVD23223.1 50S ribosomal protein L25 [Desulfuromonas acetoxidans]NVE15536.1 50S ribosomal protein L25 [Desulfuromonas acetoxidans]
MAQAELNVALRERVGKGGARSARRNGLVPGVVYGPGIEPCTVNVEPKALQEAISGEAGWNTLLTLKGDGPFDGVLAVVKDIQVDAIRRDATHVDFQAIDSNKMLSFMVPVNAVGKSAGEKAGGNLQVIRKELEVVCLPANVPGHIDIDVEALEIGDVVHIDDVTAPEGVELPHDVNFTVITVVGHKPSDDVEGEEGEETEEVAEGEE